MSRVAVLMSGGVDSSAAALLLVEEGHDVEGVTALLWEGGPGCPDAQETFRAREVCRALGVEHRVVDLRAEFRKRVVDAFRSMYLSGLTPNPCAFCNREIKFGLLMREALAGDCDAVATGHYAGLGEYGGRLMLREPPAGVKSQTYFLALIRPYVLDRLVFPLGDRTKDEARALLEARGLPARTRDSQDLCFVTGGRYAEALGREIAGIAGGGAGGRILDTEGNVVGTHRGHFAYTIGQRLGHHGRRSYVLKKRPDTNEVVVGDREMALAGRIEAGDANWFLDPAEFPDETVWVKFRYNSPAVRARLAETARGRFAVLTDEPCFAPAPGQVLACYRDGFLLGGGVITDTAP